MNNKALAPEQLQFIDNYLKSSGVKYLDIRYEMTDHIATALENSEGDFYDNFRLYMLDNKKSLLASNSRFSAIARKRAMRLLFHAMYKPVGVISFLFFFLLSLWAENYFGEEQFRKNIESGYIVIVIGVLVYLKFIHPSKDNQYSVIDKMLALFMAMLYILFVIIKPDRLTDNSFVVIGYYSLLSSFAVATVFSYRKLKKFYKIQYYENAG